MYGPVLKGKLVTLRPPQDEDAERFIEWFADPEVTRFLAHRFPPALEAERKWLKKTGESRNVVFWAIEAEGRTIGAADIREIDWLNARGGTGTLIGDKTVWGRRYGSEAVGLRTAYAFGELNLHKLTSSAFLENERSRRMLVRAGYRETGIEREHLWREGAWHDHWLCEVMRADWEQAQRGRE